jgi:hypothetical protein
MAAAVEVCSEAVPRRKKKTTVKRRQLFKGLVQLASSRDSLESEMPFSKETE